MSDQWTGHDDTPVSKYNHIEVEANFGSKDFDGIRSTSAGSL